MEDNDSSESHPYGVLPDGNAFFASKDLLNVRRYGLGIRLNQLQDSLIGDILSFLPGIDLLRVLKVSRIFYCHANCSDLWRDITLREFGGNGIKFLNNWRDTYSFTTLTQNNSSFSSSELISHKPLRIDGIYSTYLHRSWSCHTCDFASACPGFYTNNDIVVRSAKALSVADFITQFELPNIPVVITDSMEDCCPALTKWSNEYLIEKCGHTSKLRATSTTAPVPVHFTLDEYFQYASQAKEEAPLYLFERNFISIAPDLQNDYEVPRYFNGKHSEQCKCISKDPLSQSYRSCVRCALSATETCKEENPNEKPSFLRTYDSDLFKVLGETARPDYRWLVAGPARSGSIYHIDPNQTNAWNLCIRGRKKWIFYPPSTCPPGVECSADGADVVVPISTGEWLLTFWQYHLEARAHADPSKRPLEVILNPGEVIFVPHGYWHMVVNLEESIALTHNYVSTSNLSDCLRFLRDKTDQVSGVRDRGSEAIQPELMYQQFIQQLSTVLPDEVINKHIEESHQPPRFRMYATLDNWRDRNSVLMQRSKKKRSAAAARKKRKVSTTTTTTTTVEVDNEGTTYSDSPSNEKSDKTCFSFGFSF